MSHYSGRWAPLPVVYMKNIFPSFRTKLSEQPYEANRTLLDPGVNKDS